MQMEYDNWNKKGLAWFNGELYVAARDNSGTEKYECIESITADINHALPCSPKTFSTKLTTNFCDWISISQASKKTCHEFFDINFEDFNHQIFSFTQCGIEYVVPALAFIKALIHPRRALLSYAFKPNFLENIVCIRNIEGDIQISLQRDRFLFNKTRPVAYIQKLYTWFATHPSATAMINSIHNNSRSGRIGVDLPKAIIHAKFLGIQISDTFLVNEIVLNRIEPSEVPSIYLGNSDNAINIKENQHNVRCARYVTIENHEIPLRNDGSSFVTCDEWEKIKTEIGLSQHYLSRFKYCPRLQLSAILQKLHSKSSWRDTEFGKSDWRTAATLYRSLKTTGKLEKILNILKDLRA